MISASHVQGLPYYHHDVIRDWQTRGGRGTMRSFDPPNYPVQTQSVLKGVSEPLLHMESPNTRQINLDGGVMNGLSQK